MSPLVRELSLSKSFLGQTLPHNGSRTRAPRTEDKTRQIRAKDLEKGSSENYLGGEPWTRSIGYVRAPLILQSGQGGQTQKSHNTFFDILDFIHILTNNNFGCKIYVQ